jgi:DDB1- and CUL4-associated factor 6
MNDLLTSVGHPYEPMLAVSGIDHTIKIFSPDHRAQRDARLGRNINIDPNQSSGTSSISWSRRRNRTRASENSTDTVPGDNQISDEDETIIESVQPSNGLTSRKRLQNRHSIITQNDVERAGGNNEAYLTVSRTFVSPSLSCN